MVSKRFCCVMLCLMASERFLLWKSRDRETIEEVVNTVLVSQEIKGYY